MKDVMIEVKKVAEYAKLSEAYELPQEAPCGMREGMRFLSVDGKIPNGICEEAWKTLEPFVKTLAAGGSEIYGKWMKDPCSAMISCNDGFRPVSFYVRAIDVSHQ